MVQAREPLNTRDVVGPHVSELFDVAELDRAIAEGFVRSRRHSRLPLWIFNYTEHAQYRAQWDVVTRSCRGLIIDDDQRVVARPWAKFFEYRSDDPSVVELDAAVEVADKLDGSLGILYHCDGAPAIATRGSFDGEQAIHGTALYIERYAQAWTPNPEWTYLFEIVYPDNRIVLDYGATDDLILLGAVRIRDGYHIPVSQVPEWPGPKAAVMPAVTLRDALALPPREGAEGLVVSVLGTDTKYKIKQDDYLRLHRIITGTSVLAVWEHLSTHGDVELLLDQGVPDEFHAWVRETSENLQRQYEVLETKAHNVFQAISERLGSNPSRKDFAIAAGEWPDVKPFLFNLLDGNTERFRSAIWRSLRPTGNEINPV